MKTTKKDFELFKKECERWIEFFGLKGWEIRYFHEKRDNGSYAWYTYNFSNRCVWMYFNANWEDKVTKEQIEFTARHEMLEILLLKIRHIAGARYLEESEIDTAIHEIIRTLENTLFERL